MRVTFQTEGGILPSLAQPIVIDTDTLAQADVDTLDRLVRDADFFNLPTTVNMPAKGAADYRSYTITIADGKRKHSIRVTDPVPANLQPLINHLRSLSKAMRASKRTPPT